MTFWQSRHRGAPGAQASSLRSADTYSIRNDATVLHKATKQSHLLSVNKPNFNISWSADLITLQYSKPCHPYRKTTASFWLPTILHREQWYLSFLITPTLSSRLLTDPSLNQPKPSLMGFCSLLEKKIHFMRGAAFNNWRASEQNKTF